MTSGITDSTHTQIRAIIVEEHGDVSVFESVDHVVLALEAVDVANGEYIAYDGEARLLILEVRDDDPAISIREAESTQSHADDLRRTLIGFFVRTARGEGCADMSISQLVSTFVLTYGYTR